MWNCGWGMGRVAVGRYHHAVWRRSLDRAVLRSIGERSGWDWTLRLGAHWWDEEESDPGWGPFRWQVHGFDADNEVGEMRFDESVTLPCWLLALAAGAWPAGSVALFVRRRRRLRRLAHVGCCRRCGYDLRATPEPAGAGGGSLAVCPECGNQRMNDEG
jgi:hypothetical protein